QRLGAARPQCRRVAGVDDPPGHRPTLAAQPDEAHPRHDAAGRGRQNIASRPAVAATATPRATPPPVQPVTSMPAAWSTDRRPGPSSARTSEVTESTSTYSYPSLKTKNPLGRWARTPATSITEMTAAQASGVSRPASSSAPAPTSVATLSHACSLPYRRP